jgi:hypothetical protein
VGVDAIHSATDIFPKPIIAIIEGYLTNHEEATLAKWRQERTTSQTTLPERKERDTCNAFWRIAIIVALVSAVVASDMFTFSYFSSYY